MKFDLSIIIVSYNTRELTRGCIKSVLANTKSLAYEIILVDNASADGSVEELGKLGIKIIKNKRNLGFAAANNQGYQAAGGKHVLFLNSDTLVHDNVLKNMVDWMEKNPETGVITCSLKNKDGSIQGTGGYFPTLLRVFSWMTIQDIPGVDAFIKPFHPMHSKSFKKETGFYLKKRPLDWVTGAFLLTRKDILVKVRGWDDKYFMYVEEVDLCYRIKKLGYEVWYNPATSITHFGGASGSSELSVISEFEGLKRFYRKFYPPWEYPLLRFLLKLGALGRIILFGILEGKKGAGIYARAFAQI